MSVAPLCAVVTTDFAGITRGRALPAARFEAGASTGVGWLQANLALLPDGGIATPNPWGSRGDLRLIPDLAARFTTDGTGAETSFDLVCGDLVEMDGAPWPGCTRAMLRAALADLRRICGLSLSAAFEHEFQLIGEKGRGAHPLSFANLRRVDPLGPRLVAALEAAGVEPEVFIAEFGRDQFEISCAPADGLVAADRAVAVREITREVVRGLNGQASFSPKTTPDSVGNGVHIHFSLWDGSGRPATHAPDGPGGLSPLAAAFCAGILEHQAELVAFTAPSPVSYLRLRPGSWSAGYSWMAVQDREASLRICPGAAIAGRDLASQFNIEYRPADALANPYLALAALVRAGIDGIERGLTPPPLLATHPDQLTPAQRRRAGIASLPKSASEALDALERGSLFRNWLASPVGETFLAVRRAELAWTKGLEDEALCDLYRALY